ncbi:o-succinylbenzoate--CoA ligase [Robertmurraya kyonggiensis]|uniref:2-succinylbenzoate--CoA ligase n=1 Tax=Robertmurraya kyonggiensis TaxID=1037680 RepID=A0A4U1D0X3_9BACI|nr:o-succinylbenzoate--CoA ligase [Robertmurraya kyonggiensis]TKC15909.1 o-succinylbenzoate--CoA ligase [Robertmurraya kyonggiensis]
MNSQTIPNLLSKRVSLTPHRSAIQFENRTYTFQEIYDLSFQMAGHLQGLGVRKGSYVSVLLKNHIDTVVVLLSLQLLGGIAVILNNRLTAEELVFQIDDSKSMLLITEDSFLEKVEELNALVPIVSKESIRESPYDMPLLVKEIALDDVCTVMYTSGTTGNPKGVLQTYGNHWWSATGSALNLGILEEDCWLCVVPMFHISGYSILMKSIIYGMRMILQQSFDASETIKVIKEEKVTIMSVVTTMLSRVIEELGEDRLSPAFRCMLSGGGPVPLPLLEKCVEKNVPVYQTYGMTETSSQIVTLSPEYSIKKLGSAGKPLFPSQLKIVDTLGNEAGSLESGEIVVKGPNVTPGYLNRDEVMSDGWLNTGDIGYVDEDGFLYVQDRRSDLIISGGENIYPAEIEGVLTSHPDILDAGVIGVEHNEWGQVPAAFVVSKESLLEKEISEFCAKKLAKYKLPKKFYFIEEIPRNASRKLLRRELRKMYEELR